MTTTDQLTNQLTSKLERVFPDAVQEIISFLDETTVVVNRAAVVDVCTFLRDDPDLAFNYLSDLSAVDMWPEQPRFEVNIQLLAMTKHPQPGQGARRLRVKIQLEEQDARMPTLSGVWPSANWCEREAHDLFGIEFAGHPDLRPLLLPDDWDEPPPLRRDIPVHVEEVAFSFNQERIYRNKRFAKE
jgi:NADH-quinone oxidoreductase subunit C